MQPNKNYPPFCLQRPPSMCVREYCEIRKKRRNRKRNGNEEAKKWRKKRSAKEKLTKWSMTVQMCVDVLCTVLVPCVCVAHMYLPSKLQFRWGNFSLSLSISHARKYVCSLHSAACMYVWMQGTKYILYKAKAFSHIRSANGMKIKPQKMCKPWLKVAHTKTFENRRRRRRRWNATMCMCVCVCHCQL